MTESLSGNKNRFPRIPAKNWNDLRTLAQKSVPSKLNATVLQTLLGIGEGAAKNLIPTLRLIGLIDDSDKPTAEFNKWRMDDTYPKFCADTMKRLYPSELISIAAPPNPDYVLVTNWFAKTCSVGIPAARQMASTYKLLAEADPSGVTPGKKTSPKKQTVKLKPSSSMPKKATSKPEGNITSISQNMPSLQFNLQIHIGADASTEQIDQIFASIAKHLGGANRQ